MTRQHARKDKYRYDVASRYPVSFRDHMSQKIPFRTIPLPRANYKYNVMFSSPVFGVYAPRASGWCVALHISLLLFNEKKNITCIVLTSYQTHVIALFLVTCHWNQSLHFYQHQSPTILTLTIGKTSYSMVFSVPQYSAQLRFQN